MTFDPLMQLVTDSLELMNRAFTPRGSSWGAMLEFYHQFRKMWDRGIPVGLGLGHLILRIEAEDDFGRDRESRCPNLLFIDQLGEKGRLTEKLAILEFRSAMEHAESPLRLLGLPGDFRYRIAIILGTASDLDTFPISDIAGVQLLPFDIDRMVIRKR